MTEKTYILGADPGKKGAIVLLSSRYDPTVIEKDDIILFPTRTDKSGNIDVVSTFAFLQEYKDRIELCCMEQVHAFGVGKSSAQATFGFGHAVGTLQTMLQLLEKPVLTVSPPTWQKYVWKPKHIVYEESSNKGMEAKKKRDTKATSLNAAHDIFPGVSFVPTKRATKEHDGCVDAALIARYGLLAFKGVISLGSAIYL